MLRNTHKWLAGYIKDRVRKSAKPAEFRPIQIFLAICDHFEPLWNKADYRTGLKRVMEWRKRYPAIADKYKDADGATPKYTLFYPIEEYKPEYMSLLAEMCHEGYGEVEVHLHHDNDTADNLRKTLLSYKNILADNHNLLSRDRATGEVRYGFIHGNWALNNSRPDGRLCGVDNELEILRETGCYADFTMPSAPDVTQFPVVNSIYYQDDLLMVQGPLMLNWNNRKSGVFPRIENGFIGRDGRITRERIDLWVKAGICAAENPDHIFIKLYTHGCQEDNMEYLLGGGLDELFSTFLTDYNNGINYNTHFVSAREMVNVIKATEDRCAKNPADMKEYELKRCAAPKPQYEAYAKHV